MDSILAFLSNHQNIVTWVSVLSALFFVGSLIIIPILVSRLPKDYFLRRKRLAHGTGNPRSMFMTLLVVLKNLLGVCLILSGIAMLILPGQGLLTILIGLSLTNFPGKYTLERKLVRNPSIFAGLNWIRHKTGQPALQFPE